MNSDAYATGMVLVALEQGIGMPVSDRVYRRGVAYLLDTQESDGSWFVHKRAAASNAYFDSGFPYGKFQFISYRGELLGDDGAHVCREVAERCLSGCRRNEHKDTT